MEKIKEKYVSAVEKYTGQFIQQKTTRHVYEVQRLVLSAKENSKSIEIIARPLRHSNTFVKIDLTEIEADFTICSPPSSCKPPPG